MARHRTAPKLAIGILLGLVAVYALYILTLEYRCSSLLQDVRAAGEPVSVFDLDAWYEDVPAAENAAELYLRAAANYSTLYVGSEGLPFVGSRDEWQLGAPVSPELNEAIAAHLAEAKTSLDLLHTAASMPRCRYPIDLTMGFNVELPHLAQLRHQARLLALDSLYHANNKEADASIQDIEDTFAIGRSLVNEPILISQLVRIACNGIACASAMELLSRVDLTNEQYDRLDKIFADAYLPEGMVRAFVGERCTMLTGFENVGDAMAMRGEMGLRGAIKGIVEGTYFISGIRSSDRAVFLSASERLIEDARQPFPAGLHAMEATEQYIEDTPTWRAPLTHMLLPAIGRALDASARDQALSRAARTALAIERYRIAKGALPAALTDLVPEFLPEVFLDPFDGRPLRYIQTPEGYQVYTIGEDGQDDGGEQKSHDGGKKAKGRDFGFRVVKNYIPEPEEQ